jgi:glycosyltransferase involved in cell wall biosynthesis
MMVGYRKSEDPTVRTFVPPMDFATRLRRRIRAERIARSFARYRSSRPAGYERFSDDRSCHGYSVVEQLPACDVINLHWIAGFVDYQAFFSAVPEHVPIFWRLADMNPLTGGCHFDDGCGRYVRGCGGCPQLGSTETGDLSRQIWRRKQLVFGHLNPERLQVVALNRWMANTVKQSPLLGKFPVAIVPNGIDTSVFVPHDKRKARDLLGLPQDRLIVLFAADAVSNRRKGFALLTQALNGLREAGDIFFVSIGRGAPTIETTVPHLHLGHVDDDRRLSLIYSATDVYVIPSLQDNQPNTALEATACGTPVVGFNVGGITDMVRPGITGLLVPPEDVISLRAAIVELLRSSEKRAAMAIACRKIVIEEYTLAMQVERYVALYECALQRMLPDYVPETRSLATVV